MTKALFTATIFVSAFLLFLVQPLFARMALPLLGGSASVWNTALVFYQATLLAGYAYAHWAAKKLSRGRWVFGHVALMAVGLSVLPLHLPDIGNPPVDSNPIPWLLALLTLGVGLPFFAVSTTSPLIQRWFSLSGHRQSGNPYFLYAASNVGSFAALLGYPVLFETNLRLREQSQLWAGGYLVLLVLIGACAWVVSKAPALAPDAEHEVVETLTWARRARWVALAFVPSALLMGVTGYVSTEIAAVPLLWVIPLSLYLLTFVVTFADRRWIKQSWLRFSVPLFIVLPLIATLGRFRDSSVIDPKLVTLGAGFLGYFGCCLFCHGELAEDRPKPARLTEFFLWLSLGGVLGGLFCGLVAPVVFREVLEYPLALVLCAALIPRPSDSRPYQGWVWPGLVLAAAFGSLWWLQQSKDWLDSSSWKAMLVPAVLSLFAGNRPWPFAVCVAATAFVPLFLGPIGSAKAYQSRSFFGTITVKTDDWRSVLTHGTTVHGQQFRKPPWSRYPISYYHSSGPAGDLMQRRPLPADASVAVVGLGIGTTPAYSKAGQSWIVFEIDPDVVKIANDHRFFTYLRDAAVTPDIVLGDARTSLARLDKTFDVIVLDAYSSDAVPIHLITVEAFRLYLDHLRPGGVLAVHISNRYMDLWPVVAANSRELGLVWRRREDNDDDETSWPGKYASTWMLVTRDVASLGPLAKDPNWFEDVVPPGFRPWTDDRSSILDVLRGSPWNKTGIK